MAFWWSPGNSSLHWEKGVTDIPEDTSIVRHSVQRADYNCISAQNHLQNHLRQLEDNPSAFSVAKVLVNSIFIYKK